MQQPSRPNSGQPTLEVIEGRASASARSEPGGRLFAAAIAGAVLLGFFVRAGFVLSADFPIMDGGLFLVMAEDLQQSGYALPAFTSYNTGEIPFAYPPLGIYAGALLDDLTPMGLTDVLRVVPLLVSTLSIVAFYLFARSLRISRLEQAASVFAFALLPRAFFWMIMGGGLTRSFGLVFALLALQQIVLMGRSARTRHAVAAGVFGGLTALSHLEWAWFVAFSAPVLLMAYGRSRDSVWGTLIAGGVAVTVASPWWVAVVAEHGLAPFQAASQTASQTSANPVLGPLLFTFTDEPLFPLIGALGLLGVLASLAQRRFLLPCWFGICLLLDAAAVGTVASVPLALLAGFASVRVVLPLLQGRSAMRPQPGEASAVTGAEAPSPVAPRWLAGAVAAVAFVYALLSAALVSPAVLSAMSPEERDAMGWVAANTPVSSRFLVVTADRWAIDRTSEWFPALARRTNLATPQGYEFVPGRQLAEQIAAYNAAQRCGDSNAACLDAWAREYGQFDYVYIPRLAPRNFRTLDPDECCAGLRSALMRDVDYAVVYDGPGATVFAVRTSVARQPGSR